MEGIRRTDHDFYREKNPTLEFLLAVVKDKCLFDGEQITLRKLLHKLGFRYKQVNDKQCTY